VNEEGPEFFYHDGESCWEALVDLADAFAARLLPLRDGRIFIMDRLDVKGMHVGQSSPAGTLPARGLKRPSPYESLRNAILVNTRPHAVAPFKAPYIESYYRVAWSNPGPIKVLPGVTLDIDVRYPTGEEKAGIGSFVAGNAAGSIFLAVGVCWSNADKTGTRLDDLGSGQGQFSVLMEFAPIEQAGYTYTRPVGNKQSFVRVRFRNTHATLSAYFFDSKVMLIGIRETGSPARTELIDAASVAKNGVRHLEIKSKWIQFSAQAALTAQAYADALSVREKASPATVVYKWSGEDLYQKLLTYDLGVHVNFGTQGGASALENFGMWGRWLIVGQSLRWLAADGQAAEVSLTYEYAGLSPVLTFERTSVQAGGAMASSITWAHQIDLRADRLLTVGVTLRAFESVASITYGGVALTRHAAVQPGAGDFPRAELWYLIAPVVGTANLVVTLTGGEFAQCVASNFYNVNQVRPVGVAAAASGSGSPISLAVAGALGGYALDVLGYWNPGADAIQGAGQILLGRASSDGAWKIATSYRAAAASVLMSWNLLSPYAQVSAVIREV